MHTFPQECPVLMICTAAGEPHAEPSWQRAMPAREHLWLLTMRCLAGLWLQGRPALPGVRYCMLARHAAHDAPCQARPRQAAEAGRLLAGSCCPTAAQRRWEQPKDVPLPGGQLQDSAFVLWEVCMSLQSRLKMQESCKQPCLGSTEPLQYHWEMPWKLALQAASWKNLHVCSTS